MSTAETVEFVAYNLACDGSVDVDITGTVEPGTMVSINWASLDTGLTLNYYSFPFPGTGTYTYYPEPGTTLGTNFTAHVGTGDLQVGDKPGRVEWENRYGCGSGAPETPADAARACQQGEWHKWTRQDNTYFRNTGQCIQYVAAGGTLKPKYP